VSARADIITKRTYCRQRADGSFEAWPDVVDRVVSHQKWLWERALTHRILPSMPLRDLTEDMPEWVILDREQSKELEQLGSMLLNKKASVAGRQLWLGGTWVSKNREISQFNCTAIKANTVYDIVDIFWSLLNGAGVGFTPVTGMLTGFRNKIDNIESIRSTREDKGYEHNQEIWDDRTGTLTLVVGDSAEAWAKFIGKLLAIKVPVKNLVLDYSEIRPGGTRLKNYGWISQGDAGLSSAVEKIIAVLNKNVNRLLSAIDILDIVNLLGTVLSTRRSAQIALYNYKDSEWYEFATAKAGMYEKGLSHRSQSNNSLLFDDRPSLKELNHLLTLLDEGVDGSGGNGEPGLVNRAAMKSRAPWAELLNPCAEILLPDTGGACNLVTIDIGKYKDSMSDLLEDMRVLSRANYRQTCVDMGDGILQESWQLNAEFLRLCGVSMMGIAKRGDLKEYDYRTLSRTATAGACSMAEELGTPMPKNVSTIKPEGTISKCFDSTEGVHTPMAKYIINNVAFSTYDPIVQKLRDSNYRVFNHPTDPSAVLVSLPISYEDVKFDVVNGLEINKETAIEQLDKYKMLMDTYCDQNVSCTISYSSEELEEIADWLYSNWDNYVAVSFLKRNDVTKTAKDLGHPYLPQEVVTKEEYYEYFNTLTEVTLDDDTSQEDVDIDASCATGACPVR